MTKRLLLAIVCIVAVTVSAEAQKRERKLKRIDRGVQEKVFIPKGQWMAGGSVSYSEHEEDNLNFLVLKNVEGKGYNFKVSPYFGYFFADNLAAGFRFAYNRTYLDMPNFELNLGDDLNISLEDLYYLQHKYEASGFFRSYMPIGNSKIFGLFNELRLTYGHSTERILQVRVRSMTGRMRRHITCRWVSRRVLQPLSPTLPPWRFRWILWVLTSSGRTKRRIR